MYDKLQRSQPEALVCENYPAKYSSIAFMSSSSMRLNTVSESVKNIAALVVVYAESSERVVKMDLHPPFRYLGLAYIVWPMRYHGGGQHSWSILSRCLLLLIYRVLLNCYDQQRSGICRRPTYSRSFSGRMKMRVKHTIDFCYEHGIIKRNAMAEGDCIACC